MESTWRNAIIRVLREAQMPLDYREISTLILTQGYYETEGATPHATVNAQITASIKHDGAATPFIKVGKGVFGLEEVLGTIIQVDTPKTLSKPTLETLLIESLEPPQNRQRGDGFSAVEYIQDVDPELREREIQNTLRALEQQMRNGT